MIRIIRIISTLLREKKKLLYESGIDLENRRVLFSFELD